MADNVTADPGSGGAVFATDDVSSVHYPINKITVGALDSAGTLLSGGTGVDDAGCLRITLATDVALPAGTNAIGKLAANSGVDIGDVDILTFPSTVHSEDFDSGAGTDTTLAFGIAVPASGGAVVCPGDATAGLKVDLGTDNDVTVTSGTITTVSTVTNLSQLGGAAVPIGAGVEATAVRVTLPTDGTGIVGLATGSNTIGAVNIAAAQTLATVTTVSTVTNLSQLGGAAVPIGAGVEATAVRVTLPTDGTGVVGLAAGTNAIGKLSANSGVDIGDVDILSIAAGDNNIGNVDIVTQPARDRLTDNVGVALQTDALLNDTTALTPKFAVIDVASSGDNTIVAAVVGKKIRVHAVWFIAAAAVTARFEDGAAGTALTGQMQVAANGGFVLPFNPVGWFETSANTLLNLELSGAISCDGSLVYTEV